MTTKEQEFTKLVKEQKNTIYTVCMMFGEDVPVEDLVQQTLINLWKGYDGFEGRSNPGTWVWRVAMNTCLTAQKKEKKHKRKIMNKQIILITTSGCYGCEIIKNTLNELIEEENYDIDIKEIDYQNPDYKQFIKDNNITDFPTTLFVKYD